MNLISMIVGRNTTDYEKVSFLCENQSDINQLITNIYQALIFNNNCITIVHKKDSSFIIENNNDNIIKESIGNPEVKELSIFNNPKMIILYDESNIHTHPTYTSKFTLKISHDGYKPFNFSFDEFEVNNVMNWTDVQEGNDYKALKFNEYLFAWAYGNPSLLKIINHQ